MKTCKDCLHYEACNGTYCTAKGCDNIALYDFDGEMYADSGCEDFADRSDSISAMRKFARAINAGQEANERAKRRPRATYYQTTKFYNFRKQKKSKAKI